MSDRTRKILTLLAFTSSLSLLLLDVSILPVAIPTIRQELHLPPLFSQWLINAYLLTLASFVFAGGRVADIFGHRRIFCLGLFVFGFGTCLGGVAHVGETLLTGRIIQGLGGAMMGPASQALLYNIYPIGERGRVVGIVTGLSSLFIFLGPSIGGVCTQYLSWRWIFWSQLPLVIGGICLTLKVLPQIPGKRDSFDFPGFLSLTLGLASLTLGFMQGREWGWSSPLIMLFFMLFMIFILLLFTVNGLARHPFLNVSLLGNRFFVKGNLILFCTQFMMMMAVLLPVYFQLGLGLSPVKTGLYMVIETCPVIFCGPISGYLSDLLGPKHPSKFGFSFLIVAFSLFALLPLYFHLSILWIALFVMGCGLSLVQTPTSTTTLSYVHGCYNGEAIGLFNTTRYTGSAIGLAIFWALSNNISSCLFKKSLISKGGFENVNLYNLWNSIGAGFTLPYDHMGVHESFVRGTNIAFMTISAICVLIAIVSLSLCLNFYKKSEAQLAPELYPFRFKSTQNHVKS